MYRQVIAAKVAAKPPRLATQGDRLVRTVRIAAALAWSDIRHRYVRSLLGPFWMSFQMAVVAVLGSVIGHMSNASTVARLPMLALGITAWTFLNSVVLDATTALQNSASLIRDRALPPVIFLLQCTFRQALFALHNACVPLVLWLILSPDDPLTRWRRLLPAWLLFIACTLRPEPRPRRDWRRAIATSSRSSESTLMLASLSSPVIWPPR